MFLGGDGEWHWFIVAALFVGITEELTLVIFPSNLIITSSESSVLAFLVSIYRGY